MARTSARNDSTASPAFLGPAVSGMQNGPKAGRFQDADADKLRGGYYTSRRVAEWLCSWAIRSADDRIVEPSCGDGAFLRAAAAVLCEKGAKPSKVAKSLVGIEINSTEAEAARGILRRLLRDAGNHTVVTGDFFEWTLNSASSSFDVVIGNPPFIRYQTFPEPHRSLAMSIMADVGLTPNRLTNIWVPFVVAGARLLRPGGRMAFVLPAELLQVTYAAQLRSYLVDRFKRIDIIACNELFFENAEQEVVLLLAENALPSPTPSNVCRVGLIETATVEEITSRSPQNLLSKIDPKVVRHDNEKWLKYFLSQREIDFLRDLRSSAVATSLSTHATVDVGVVTGKNEFFVLDGGQIEERRLAAFTIPLVSRSAHLSGAVIDKAEWKGLAKNGDRVHLLHLGSLNGGKLPKSLGEYVREGEQNAYNRGYKCSIRSPWYAVPSVWIPDGFLFRQIYDFPRAVLNTADATSTDTIHRLTCKGDRERIIANMYTHLTAASAEVEGRSYGGGVLELEPTEAERLLMPAQLADALPLKECDRLIRAGGLEQVLQENAKQVLIKGMGMSKSDCEALKTIWTKMRDRRMSRRRKRKLKAGL